VAPILQSIYPRVVELATTDDHDGLATAYHQGAQLVAVMTTPVMLLLAVFPHGVIYAWSGDAALAARTAPLLSPLALGTFLNGLMWVPYHAQLAHGWTSLTIRVNVVAVLVIVPALLWLVPRHGALAAAWIWVAVNAAYLLVAVQLMHRRILRGEKARWYLEDVGAPIACAVAPALLLWPFAPMDMTSRLQWVAVLVSSAIAASAGALAGAWRIRRSARALIRGVVGV
jgi:O-antigen/teichoic acid export membrane protein